MYVMLYCGICIWSMSLSLILDLVPSVFCFGKCKPRVMVVIKKNGFALIFLAQSSSVQICEMNARMNALLLCLECLR